MLKPAISLLMILLSCALSAQEDSFYDIIENKGQWQKEVDYKSNISNGTFFLQQQGFTVLLQHEKDRELFFEQMHFVGNKSIFIIGLTSSFTGMVFAYQIYTLVKF